MPKIVIDARESGTSTGRHIDKVLEYLHNEKTEHEIIVLTKPHRVEVLKKVLPTFRILPSRHKEFSFAEQLGLAWQIYRLKPDLVHFFMTNQPILYFKRSVTTIHDLTTARFYNPAKNYFIFKFKQLIYRLVILFAAHKSKRILTISNYVKHDIISFAHVKPEKIKVTYLAADKITERPERVMGLANDKFIMYVGRPQPHKNLERLVEAFSLLKRDYPNLKLVLVGKKDVLYERLEIRVEKEAIGDIIFAGFMTDGQLRWLYETTAAYVFPSLSEGFGLPGLEAMVHGAPVVASRATCLPEIYGQAAHYFNPLDTQDIAHKVSEVLGDENLRRKMVKDGYSQAARYSWSETASQTLEVYNQALGQ